MILLYETLQPQRKNLWAEDPNWCFIVCVKIWPRASFIKISKCLSVWSVELIGLSMQIPFIFPKLNIIFLSGIKHQFICKKKKIMKLLSFSWRFSQISLCRTLKLWSSCVCTDYIYTWLSLWIAQRALKHINFVASYTHTQVYS